MAIINWSPVEDGRSESIMTRNAVARSSRWTSTSQAWTRSNVSDGGGSRITSWRRTSSTPPAAASDHDTSMSAASTRPLAPTRSTRPRSPRSLAVGAGHAVVDVDPLGLDAEAEAEQSVALSGGIGRTHGGGCIVQ